MSWSAGLGNGLHASAVVYGEYGVVILGPSGSGKSALALALLAHSKATGRFGALIGDDRVWIRSAGGRLLASGAPHMAGLIERRGAGTHSVRSEFATVVKLFVELSPPNRSWPRWPSKPDISIVEGIGVPRLPLNSISSAIDNALSVVERLTLIGAYRGDRISLEHCAAVHKNKNLVISRTASTTSEAGAGRLMDI